MKVFAKLANLKRFNCLAHSINRLIQHDLMACKDPVLLPLKNLLLKLRSIQKRLIFKGEELSIDFEELQIAASADEQIQPFERYDNQVDSQSTFGDLRAVLYS